MDTGSWPKQGCSYWHIPVGYIYLFHLYCGSQKIRMLIYYILLLLYSNFREREREGGERKREKRVL